MAFPFGKVVFKGEWHLLKSKTTVIPAKAGIQTGLKTTGFPPSRE